MLRDTLASARARLVKAGIAPDEAAVDVDLFARSILGWDRAKVLTESGHPVPRDLEPMFTSWVERRAQREPSAYITGVREFYGLDFEVSPAVLIPRPETEFIIEAALPLLVRRLDPRIADIGTGCGNLAVTLAHEIRGCSVVATDISPEALQVAARNAGRHRVTARVEFRCTSYLDGVSGPFDLVVANPPYVRDGDRAGLSRTVLREPSVALFGGPDGLRDIEGVLRAVIEPLRPGGRLLMEFGYGQEDDVRACVAAHPELTFERAVADLQGLPRTAIIMRERRGRRR
jgi:release factor glutamine methyltransferase